MHLPHSAAERFGYFHKAVQVDTEEFVFVRVTPILEDRLYFPNVLDASDELVAILPATSMIDNYYAANVRGHLLQHSKGIVQVAPFNSFLLARNINSLI